MPLSCVKYLPVEHEENIGQYLSERRSRARAGLVVDLQDLRCTNEQSLLCPPLYNAPVNSCDYLLPCHLAVQCFCDDGQDPGPNVLQTKLCERPPLPLAPAACIFRHDKRMLHTSKAFRSPGFLTSTVRHVTAGSKMSINVSINSERQVNARTRIMVKRETGSKRLKMG